MKINSWLSSSILKLERAGIVTARLDCLILLEDTLNKNRTSILAHLDEKLTKQQLEPLNQGVNKRLKHIPLAYIRGKKQFYGLDFIVNEDVLIPRPESEAIIEIAKSLDLKTNCKIADIGTGSGALAICLAKILPGSSVDAMDISSKALNKADSNAAELNIEINTINSNLLAKNNGPYDLIVANLPYLQNGSEVSKAVHSEPDIALYADGGGLKLIKSLIDQINLTTLNDSSWLILESDINQHTTIESYAANNSLKLVSTLNLIQLYQYNPVKS